ncbi:MAG: metal-dependent transcriptional regulator [Anaerolineae bacterium]|nr:metal-dependent transcriptional regulator [Anaerolineae bacterium]
MKVRTPAVEDYLRVIYNLQEQDETATTSAIAELLGVRPASVTNMLKRLDALGLVDYVPYQGAILTPAGERIALEVVRHHRLLELYLAEAFDISWDRVHEEADRLEHVLSDDLEARIAAMLGEPTVDPHGDPIPTPDLQPTEVHGVLLSHCPPDREARVLRVLLQAPEILRYLGRLGVRPGARVTRLASSCGEGRLPLLVNGLEQVIEPELGDYILVSEEVLEIPDSSRIGAD